MQPVVFLQITDALQLINVVGATLFAVAFFGFSIYALFFWLKKRESDALETKRANSSENYNKTLEAENNQLKREIEELRSENITLQTEFKMVAAINIRELFDLKQLKLNHAMTLDEKDFEIETLKGKLLKRGILHD